MPVPKPHPIFATSFFTFFNVKHFIPVEGGALVLSAKPSLGRTYNIHLRSCLPARTARAKQVRSSWNDSRDLALENHIKTRLGLRQL